MKHPELFLIPVFMLADYFLTVLGAIQKDKKYSHHFRTEHYELNPVWQKQIAQRQWLSPLHLLATASLTIALVILTETDEVPRPVIRFILGLLLVLYGMVIGRHLSNLLIFRYVDRQAQELSGHVTMSHAMALSISLYHNLILLVPLLLVALFSPSPFVFGGLSSVLLFVLTHLRWIAKNRRRIKMPDEAVDATIV